jgi:hypothetical protein
MTAADQYRNQAAHCSDQAAKTVDPTTKAQWEKLSEEWLRLAESVFSNPGAFKEK